MSVTYGDEERLEDESGRAIRAAIVQTIEGNPLQYRTWKRRYLTEVGYEGTTLRVQRQERCAQEAWIAFYDEANEQLHREQDGPGCRPVVLA